MSESLERATRCKQIAEAVATEAAFADESCAKYNRAALVVAETIIENAEPWYKTVDENITVRDMTSKANSLSRARIRQEYGFVVSSWIMIAVLSGIISAVVRILIERWLRKEGVDLYQLRNE